MFMYKDYIYMCVFLKIVIHFVLLIFPYTKTKLFLCVQKKLFCIVLYCFNFGKYQHKRVFIMCSKRHGFINVCSLKYCHIEYVLYL